MDAAAIAQDARRREASLRAIHMLKVGNIPHTVAADHGTGETCAEVMVRLEHRDPRHAPANSTAIGAAARSGFGSGRADNLQAIDHHAGEACVEVVARQSAMSF